MFRILSIDGGGIRGIYPSHFLSLFSTKYGADLTSVFDLIVGTSSGAIVAAAAATKIPLAQVTALYEQRASQMFAPRRVSVGGLYRSKYRSEPLKALLDERFGDVKMRDVPGKLVLPCTDLSNGNVFVIKSSYLQKFVRDNEIPLATAVLASCAAPSYFDPVRVNEYLLADGGLWGNNPSLIAYTEAVGKLGVDSAEVRILSIGTGVGQQYYDVSAKPHNWGLATGWKRSLLVDTILNLQSRVSTNTAGLLLGEKYMRINFEETGKLPLDDTSQTARLKAKAGEAFTYKNESIKSFLAL